MGRKATTFKAAAVYPIKYRFTCEHCGYSGEWQVHTFTHEEQLTIDSWNAHLTPEQEKALNTKAAEGLQQKVDAAIRDCHVRRYPFSDVCPLCKKHQSWGNRKMYQYMVTVPVCVATLLTGILWMTSLLERAFGWWIVLAVTAASFLGTIVYALWRKAQTGGVANKQLPEIDWSR